MPFPLFSNPFHKQTSRSPQQPNHTAIRNRTQSLATTNSRAIPDFRSLPEDPSTPLIRKLKSYGSASSDKAVLARTKTHPRPPPLRLSNQHKPQHIHAHHPSPPAGYHPSPPSPRSRSASAAATVFDIVRPSRRRNGTQNSSTITPFTPPLPPAPLFLARRIDRSRRDNTRPNKFPPSPLSLHPQSTSRPNPPRRASSLDSITTGFQPSPHSPHQQYMKCSGFLQTSQKFSASHSECSEEVINQSSSPSTAQTTPLSSAHLRSRFSPRDHRHRAHAPKPRVVNLSSRGSLTIKSPFSSQLARPGELEPSDGPNLSSPAANWMLDISGSSTVEPTTCLVPDMPGTILRLKQTPTDCSKAVLEPSLQKVIRIGPDGNELVEWVIRLAQPTRPRFNSSPSTHQVMPQQPSPRTRNKSKSKTPAPKPILNNNTRRVESPVGLQSASGLHENVHGKKHVHPSTSVATLISSTFRASDINHFTTSTTLHARKTSNATNDDSTQAPPSLSSLFPLTTSPAKSVLATQHSLAQPRSPSPSSPTSSASCSSSSLSPAEEEDQDTEEFGKPIIRRNRFDTYVSPVNRQTTAKTHQSGSEYLANLAESKSRRQNNPPENSSYPKLIRPDTEEDGDIRINDPGGDDDSMEMANNHQMAFNLERQLAHSKLLGLSDPAKKPERRGHSSAAKSSKHVHGEADENALQLPHNRIHQHGLSRNSNLSSNADANSVLEKSYWSETDTTTSCSVVNFKIFNGDD